MPLFMDIHKFAEITVEDVKKAHLADEAVQDQYGVKYHQFWVNEEAGTVFCLVEGPDMETCQLVHQQAHGNIACNLAEVETGFFKLFMGDGLPVEHGLVQNEKGSADPGYRHIMVIDIRAMTQVTRPEDYKHLWLPHKPKNLVLDRIARFNGRVVEKLGDDSLVGVFNTAVNAVRCTKDIQHEFSARKSNHPDDQEWNVSFRMSLCTGQPLTEGNGFFTEAITLGRRLCIVADNNEVVASSLIKELCDLEDTATLRTLNLSEEKFLMHLFEITEANLPNTHFNVDYLSRDIGISRPQLYRKILSLTGRSPNDFIHLLRMAKAMSLIRRNHGNISEIALEVGYQNPSYFSKCFHKNYGCRPSEFIKVRTSA